MFNNKKYMDAGLVDMISIEQSIRRGNKKHIVLSTKEKGYVRKPAPKYQQLLAKLVYHDDKIVDDLRRRHERYNEQWDKIAQLEKEGKALVLRPSKDIGVSRYEARAYIDNYLNNYRGVKEYMHKVVADARENGYTETLYGRRRYIPELKSSNFNMREFGKRVALNMPVQGTAADIMKLAMVRVHHRLKREGLRARLLMQVHDELIIEAPLKEKDIAARILTEEMENAFQMNAPLVAEAKSGMSWYDAK